MLFINSDLIDFEIDGALVDGGMDEEEYENSGA